MAQGWQRTAAAQNMYSEGFHRQSEGEFLVFYFYVTAIFLLGTLAAVLEDFLAVADDQGIGCQLHK